MNTEQIENQHIADALWQNDSELNSTTKNNSSEIRAKQMQQYLSWLTKNQQSFNPNYNKRYIELSKNIPSLTAQQAYILRTNFLGRNCSEGFEQIPPKADLQFPRDHHVKYQSQVGWHFFVGSVWAEDGQEYGVELMFFRIALFPPKLAKLFGLTDIENQIVEMQLAISKAGEAHHQADPVVIAGTTGLIDFSKQLPFVYKIGNNSITSTKTDSLFPLKIQTKGWDRAEQQPFELGLDLEVSSNRDILYQGDNGAMPSLAGFGTLYYSIPNLNVKAGSTINYGGKQIKLKKGLMWFDHQWGFMSGNPNSKVLRAATNMSKSASTGWDWYMHQFGGNRQTTVFATHSTKLKNFYFQSGPKPPGTMTVSVSGKYMDEQGKLHDVWGELSIDSWAKADKSSNPDLYPVTNVWHPNHWRFKFDQTVPEDIREFTMEQIVPVAQTNFFANTAQYNEGAVYIKDRNGKNIGRGFAEAVSYADTSNNAYRLLGFDKNKQLIKVLQNQSSSLPKRIASFLYVMIHQNKLKKVLANAGGMKFMGPKPKTHVSRH